MSWIVVTNWAKFQHYSDREPSWIKLYLELAHRSEWFALSASARGLLVSCWIEFALSKGVLETEQLRRRTGLRATQRDLESLVHAGFIEISASRPSRVRAGARAGTRSREKELPSEVKNPQTPADAGAQVTLTKKELRRFTGCRLTRGTHGFGHVRDPLGQDRPPADWPHEEPSMAEVMQALAATGKEN